MKKEKLDNLLEILSKDKSPIYEKTYYRPSKGNCVIGFICSLIFLILLIVFTGFKFQMIYILLYGVDIIIILFYGINLFSTKGWYLPRHVEVSEEEQDDDKYRVQ